MQSEKTVHSSRKRVLFLTQFGILLAIEAIFCFTPLGSLPALGPIVATLMMIPVLITAILLGTGAGTLMGFFAGLFSFLVWTFMPPSPITAFIFTPFYPAPVDGYGGNAGSLVICFLPRILAGTVAGLVYTALRKHFSDKTVLGCSLAAILGSLTNTAGVLSGIWIFFSAEWTALTGQAILLYIGVTVLTSGIPEAVVGALVSAAVCKPAQMILARSGSK